MDRSPTKPLQQRPKTRGLGDWQAIAILIVAMLPWLLATTAQFIPIDDQTYITQNPNVLEGLSGKGFQWAFTTNYAGFWMPLTWLSLMLDVSVFGKGAAGFHFTNVMLHLANAVLVWLFLRRATGSVGRSLVVALLWAMHPLRVESVAWATERKDMLFTFFGLWALLAYTWYARRNHWSGYVLALAAYAASLLSKPTLVTLPLLLLLLDVWPLRRARLAGWRRLLLEKIPFAVFAGVHMATTIWGMKADNGMLGTDRFPVWLRIENAAVSYELYVRDQFYFGKLAVFYALPTEISSATFAAALTVLLSITGTAAWLAWRRPRAGVPLLTGWLWFLIALLPNIGLVQSGLQARADRFTYWGAIGLAAGVVWAWPRGGTWRRHPLWAKIAAAGAVTALTICMMLQLLLWRSPVALFESAIARQGDNDAYEFNLGLQYQLEGKLNEALEAYTRATTFQPRHSRALFNAGTVLARQGRLNDAVERFRRAAEIQPDNRQYQEAYRQVQQYRDRLSSRPS